YQRSGARPVQSTLTVWSRPASVTTEPDRTMVAKSGSSATSQLTTTGAPRPEPGPASGEGVARVQRITRSAIGSPEATPCRNTPSAGPPPSGPPAAAPAGAAPPISAPAPATPPAAAPARRTERRSGPVRRLGVEGSCAGRECAAGVITPVHTMRGRASADVAIGHRDFTRGLPTGPRPGRRRG